MKITLDEESIEAIVTYVKTHPKEIRDVLKLVGEEAVSILREKKMLENGAKLYRDIQRAINYTYNKD